MKLSISMTKEETAMGWLFLAIHVFFLPWLLSTGNAVLGKPLNNAMLNFIMFAVNFTLAALIFLRFLRQSFSTFFRKPLHCLLTALLHLIGYYTVYCILVFSIRRLNPEFSNPNDSSIVSMSKENLLLMIIGTAILAPPAEELLYRGLIFRSLHEKNRIVAYLVSIAAFGFLHVMNYIGYYTPGQLLVSFLQYIPAGFFLARAYERSDTILVPIIMHMTINLVAFSLTR